MKFIFRGKAIAALTIALISLAACTAVSPAGVQQAVAPNAAAAILPEAGAQDAQSAAQAPTAEALAPAAQSSYPAATTAVTVTLVATFAPPASATPVPTTAPTFPPSPTVTATLAPTLSPQPSPTTEPNRLCPETAPLKPEYSRFYLSAKKWPEPHESIARPYFWLSRPLPGAGRVLINDRFPYGWDENGRLLLHNGVDMAEDLGMPLLAVADGTVVVAQSDYSALYGWRCDWYGHLVVIELDQRWQDQPVYVLYGHVLNIVVQPGQRVERGQQVAEIGIGGAATHPHLHFEVRVGENQFASTRNPMLWLDPGPTRGVIAGRLVDPEGRPWQGVPLALVNDETGEILPSWSYLGDPQNLMNPDEGWAENFVFSDVPPGDHSLVTEIQGVTYQVPVHVNAAEVSTVEIVTESLKEQIVEPDTITPDAVTPESAAPDTIPSESATPDAITPDALTPEAAAPDAVTPDIVTPGAETGS
ncbi:MAG: peptidoglycan DD-metalloendopeptidase family protein [Candidatus Promineifilaceae bacterium]|jgi:murein DD-endopeptidase MepM/ murein hydrolase activator NlpD